MSLSADVTTLAVGAWANDGAGSNAGHARVHWWNATAGASGDWVQLGADIDGEA